MVNSVTIIHLTLPLAKLSNSSKYKNYLFFYFLNIFENNFYMVNRELPEEKDTIFEH